MASIFENILLGTKHFMSWLSYELGLKSLVCASRDVHIIIFARFLRMFSYGASALILAIYFEALGISKSHIGLFMSLTLLGDVTISLLLTLFADGLGRRHTLLVGAFMMASAGIIFANTGNYWLLLFAAVVGVISPSGNEIGPFRAVEESMIAQLVETPEQRPDIFAWYVVLAQIGTSLGLVAAGLVVERAKTLDGWTEIDAYRAVFWIYAGLGLVKCLLTLCLTSRCELRKESDARGDATQEESEPLLSAQNGSTSSSKTKKRILLAKVSQQTLPILLKLCALFFLDSLASGMVPYTLINLYMDGKFALPKDVLGTLMSSSWFCGAIFNIFAASLAKRIGLIKTMVFTHLPSAIFLALIPAPSSLLPTAMLLVARACLSSMDQAPRSAFLSAVVKPNERTAVMGIVNVVKTLSQSGGPIITGLLAQGEKFWIAFLVAGCLKVTYDIGLLVMFVNVRLHQHDQKRPEEADGNEEQIGSESGDVHGGAEEPERSAELVDDGHHEDGPETADVTGRHKP